MNKLSRTMALTLVLVFALSLGSGVWALTPSGITYNSVTRKISGANSNMEFNTTSATFDGTWTPASSNMSVPSNSTAKAYYFRYVVNADTNEVFTLHLSSSGGADAPKVSYNAAAGGIVSDTGGPALNTLEYNKISATNGTWTKVASGQTVIAVTPSTSDQTYYVRVAAVTSGNSYTPASAVATITIPRGSAPALDGKVTYDYVDEAFDIAADSGKWYYTTQSATYTGPYKYEITSPALRGYPDLTYWFSNSPTGLGSPISIPKRDDFPTNVTVGYNAVTGAFTVSGGTALEYSTGGQTYTALANGTVFAQTAKDQTVTIRAKGVNGASAAASKVASWPMYFTVWAENDKASALQNVRVYKGYILGVSTALEYFIGTEEEAKTEGAAWTAITKLETVDGFTDGLAIGRSDEDQTVWLRVHKDGTDLTWEDWQDNEIMSVIMPLSYTPPTVTLDILAQTVTGFDPGLSYVYATSGSWKDLTDAMFTDAENKTTVSITSLLTGKAVTLKFARKPATGKPEEESVTAFTIVAGAAKPTVKVAMFHLAESADVLETGTVTFTGIPDNFQFKLTTDTEWSEPIADPKDFSLEVGYTATAYQFRVAATADKQAGLPGSVKVPAPPKAPKLKVNYKKETFKPKAGSLYSADGGATWLKAPGTEIPVSDFYGGTLFIRLPPSNKKPASDAQELVLLPRVPFVPTAQDVSVQKDKKGNDVAVMRSGAWQIEYKNGAKWKKGLPKILVSDTEIRFMTNARFAPGESVILTADGLPS